MSKTLFIANYNKNLQNISDFLPEYNIQFWDKKHFSSLTSKSTIIFHTGDWGNNFQENRTNLELPHFVNSFYFDLNSLSNLEDKSLLIGRLYKKHSFNFKQYDYFSETFLPTEFGDFILFGFEDRVTRKRVLGLRTQTMPDIPTIRIHSMCYTGDIFNPIKCDCREQLTEATKLIAKKGGMLIYPEEEGRGVGILHKLKIYDNQHNGMDTVDANYAENFPNDIRTYDYLQDIFNHYDIFRANIITNNPKKIKAFFNNGIFVNKTIQIASTVNSHNEFYLRTKMAKNNHKIELK